MYLFKINKRKNWHISTERGNSYCSNAKWGRELLFDSDGSTYYEPEDDYCEHLKVDEIPENIQYELCISCVQQAYDRKIIKVVANKRGS